MRAFLLLLFLSACTLPLPVSKIRTSNSGGNIPSLSSGNNETNTPIIPLEGITLKQGYYDNRLIDFIDLNFCIGELLQDPTCANTLNNSTAKEYVFNFADGRSVPEQKPVFSTIPGQVNNSPFHVIYSVTVPDEYVADSIRSEEDVFASQFKIVPLSTALNHPVVQEGDAILEKIISKAWFNGQIVSYLDLGSIPFSARNNQLGTSPVYFLFNQDGSSELPSKPKPIFATIPGDLRYSPVRQVFVAIAENQVMDIVDDPSISIRSQDDLLTAVNNGVFRLDTTRIFFNYSVSEELSNLNPEEPKQYQFFPEVLSPLPVLPFHAHYALWYRSKNNQERIIQRFKYLPSGRMEILDTSEEFQSFILEREVSLQIDELFITVEIIKQLTPSDTTLLNSKVLIDAPINLEVPFKSQISNLSNGNFMLATPTNGLNNLETSGLWFVKRQDSGQNPPITSLFEKGLPLTNLPGDWLYKGWIQVSVFPETWMTTGIFKDPQLKDLQQTFSESSEGYPFPGEDFLLNAPEEITFPFNLISTGDAKVAVSIEPGDIKTKKPFMTLYKQNIDKTFKEYMNQDLEALSLNFPAIKVTIKEIL